MEGHQSNRGEIENDNNGNEEEQQCLTQLDSDYESIEIDRSTSAFSIDSTIFNNLHKKIKQPSKFSFFVKSNNCDQFWIKLALNLLGIFLIVFIITILTKRFNEFNLYIIIAISTLVLFILCLGLVFNTYICNKCKKPEEPFRESI